MLKSVGKTRHEYLRSFKFHARHILSGFQHLEVQSIIVLKRSKAEPKGSGTEDRGVNTNSFEFFDLFLEVSVLCMVLLVFSTSSDALGQLHSRF